MDWEKFAWFVILLLIGQFVAQFIMNFLPDEGVFGVILGVLVPAFILYYLFRRWGKRAGVTVRG